MHLRPQLLLALLLATTACIPLPYAAPPMRVDIGGGPAFGPAQVAPPRGISGTLDARATINPMQAFDPEGSRLIDGGLGWGLQLIGRRVTHGPTVVVEYFPLIIERPPGGFNVRIGVRAASDLLLGPGLDEVGLGASAGVAVEWAGFVTSDAVEAHANGEGGFIGIHHGETAVGIYGELVMRRFGGDTYGGIIFGLTFRNPAAVGVALVPIF